MSDIIGNVVDVTVTEAVDGSVRRKPRSDIGTTREKPDLTHVRLHPLVLEAVKALMVGSYTRYEIRSETEAVVR